MILSELKRLHSSSAAAFLWLALGLSTRAGAQAPPGPMTGAPSRDAARPADAAADVPRIKNLAGTWKLNLDESDDPQKKLQQARGSRGGRTSVGMGGGWPGMGGHGGYGGRRMGGESDEDIQKMHIFVEPARQITIVQKEPEIDISDEIDRKIAVYTDGRKLEKSKDPSNQQMDAKWDQYRLSMEGKDPRGNKYERSYEVLEGNRQLRETLLLKVGRSNTDVSIRYIYDLVSKSKS